MQNWTEIRETEEAYWFKNDLGEVCSVPKVKYPTNLYTPNSSEVDGMYTQGVASF